MYFPSLSIKPVEPVKSKVVHHGGLPKRDTTNSSREFFTRYLDIMISFVRPSRFGFNLSSITWLILTNLLREPSQVPVVYWPHGHRCAKIKTSRIF